MSQTTLYFLILISIHALREEGDKWACTGYDRTTISIHALREEGDATNLSSKNKSLDFYPRPPRGGRQQSRQQGLHVPEFLSTPSARRATRQQTIQMVTVIFLSTPSARRATKIIKLSYRLIGDFYPRPPRGGRLFPLGSAFQGLYFYPRPPRGGRPI